MKFTILHSGSISLFFPCDDEAEQALQDTAPEDAQFMGAAMAVEHRHVADVRDWFINNLNAEF